MHASGVTRWVCVAGVRLLTSGGLEQGGRYKYMDGGGAANAKRKKGGKCVLPWPESTATGTQADTGVCTGTPANTGVCTGKQANNSVCTN